MHVRSVFLVVGGLGLAMGLGSCGDDGGSSSSSGPSDAEVTQEVTTAYKAFFDKFAADTDALEDGDKLADIAAGLGSSAQAPLVSIEVTSVQRIDDDACAAAKVTTPCAEVVFDLLLDGSAAITGHNGHAVEQGGRWKVAQGTFCDLAVLAGTAC